MPRGGKRAGAGRPKKVSTAESVGKPISFHRPKGYRIQGDDDEGQSVYRTIHPETIHKLIRDIRRRAGGGAATIAGLGQNWQQSTVDYALTHSLYEDWPLVKSAVDWAIDTALENGYRVESENEQAKQICDKLGEVLQLDNVILPRWIKALHEDGNIFEEERWGTVDQAPGSKVQAFQAPLQLFPIPAGEMRYRWKDASGKQIEWGQVQSAGTVESLPEDTIIVESWRPDGYNPFGTPIISSVLDDVETLLTFQTDYRDIIKWYVKPLWHVLVGTPEKPASQTLVDSVRDEWEDRDPNTDLISAGNIKIEEHGIGENIPAVNEYFQYHDYKQTDGLQTPFLHVLRNASQASAAEIRDNTFSRVGFIQRWLKRLLEQLFQEVLEKNGIVDDTLRVVFQPLRAITLKDKVEFYIQLLNPQQVQLSDESRLEVEQKLRLELLGVPRDDSLVQVKEPMPGQQGLLGRVKEKLVGPPSPEDQAVKEEKRLLLRKLAKRLTD